MNFALLLVLVLELVTVHHLQVMCRGGYSTAEVVVVVLEGLDFAGTFHLAATLSLSWIGPKPADAISFLGQLRWWCCLKAWTPLVLLPL